MKPKKSKNYTTITITKFPIKLKEKLEYFANTEGISKSKMAIKAIKRGLYSSYVPRSNPRDPVLVDLDDGELAEATKFIKKEDTAHRETKKDSKKYKGL